MRGDRERGDKATKTQVPRSKYQIPSLHFMRGDRERGDKETKTQNPKFKIPYTLKLSNHLNIEPLNIEPFEH